MMLITGSVIQYAKSALAPDTFAHSLFLSHVVKNIYLARSLPLTLLIIPTSRSSFVPLS